MHWMAIFSEAANGTLPPGSTHCPARMKFHNPGRVLGRLLINIGMVSFQLLLLASPIVSTFERKPPVCGGVLPWSGSRVFQQVWICVVPGSGALHAAYTAGHFLEHGFTALERRAKLVLKVFFQLDGFC